MKAKRTLAFCLGALVLTGCASSKMDWAPPADYTVEQSITIDKPFDTVWEKLLQSMNGDIFVINNTQKDSGIITVSFATDKPSEYIDCGVTTRAFSDGVGEVKTVYPTSDSADYRVYLPAKSQVGSSLIDVTRKTKLDGRAHIVLRNEGKNKTGLTVNVRYNLEMTSSATDATRGRYIGQEVNVVSFMGQAKVSITDSSGSWECRPKGVIEKQIFDFAR